MSDQGNEVDESGFGAGGESSIDADVDAATGGAGEDQGVAEQGSDSADESVADSHASDVAAGFDDQKEAPVQDGSEEDGTFGG